MTSASPIGPLALAPINGDLTAAQLVNAANIDANNQILRAKIDELIEAVGVAIRDDNEISDCAIRLRCLDTEVIAVIGSGTPGVVWQPKVAADLATTANITLSGEQTIDGVMTSASRVLVKDQTDSTENGWYTSDAAAWIRADDTNTSLAIGYAFSTISGGTANGDTSWICTIAPTAVDLGTTALTFTRLPGCAGGATTAAQVSYFNGGYPLMANVQQALDQLLFTPMTASMAASITQAEIGSTVASDHLTWSVSKALSAIALAGSGATTPALTDTAQTVTGPWTTNQTWTLTVTSADGTETVIATASLSFLHKRYWGVSATLGSALTDANIIAMSGELATSRAATKTYTPTAQYLFYIIPASFGEPTFTVNGLLNTAWTKTVKTFVNASGNSSTYWIYQSNFLQNSPVTLVVQ